MPPALAVLLAHPLTEHGVLPISPASAAVLAGALAAVIALLWPSRGRLAVRHPGQVVDSWSGSLTTGQVVVRAVSFATIVLAAIAGRVGSERELENIAPALIIGVGWPALLVLSATLGPVWRLVDPWDGVARVVAPADADRAAGERDVYLALVPALAWTWYLGVYPDTLSPRSVGLALGVYFLATLGACLALGRLRWLPRGEVFGILFGWLARLPRGLLREWVPPRGAALLLGTLAGGLLFGEIRRTELWGTLNVIPGAVLWATLALAGSALAGAATFHALDRWASRQGAPGTVPAAVLPAVGSIGVAVAMARSRLFTSLQLLPTVVVDPFGFGWDLLGSSERSIEAPLMPGRLAVVQLAVLMAGHLAGAVVLASRRPGSRMPAALALALSMAAGTGTLVLAPGL